MHPDLVRSGEPPPAEEDHRKAFPRINELVHNIEHVELLKELLPALEKNKCLDSPVWAGRRSPWVRAFCDLHHPAGPWGERKYKKVPSIASSARHTFKSYKVQKIHEALQKCQHIDTSAVHSALQKQLSNFMSKKKYFDDCMAGYKLIAIEEAMKPEGERAPVPSLAIAADNKAPNGAGIKGFTSDDEDTVSYPTIKETDDEFPQENVTGNGSPANRSRRCGEDEEERDAPALKRQRAEKEEESNSCARQKKQCSPETPPFSRDHIATVSPEIESSSSSHPGTPKLHEKEWLAKLKAEEEDKVAQEEITIFKSQAFQENSGASPENEENVIDKDLFPSDDDDSISVSSATFSGDNRNNAKALLSSFQVSTDDARKTKKIESYVACAGPKKASDSRATSASAVSQEKSFVVKREKWIEQEGNFDNNFLHRRPDSIAPVSPEIESSNSSSPRTPKPPETSSAGPEKYSMVPTAHATPFPTMSREKLIEAKRNKLIALSRRRQQEDNLADDAVSKRLKTEINKCDDELIGLILLG